MYRHLYFFLIFAAVKALTPDNRIAKYFHTKTTFQLHGRYINHYNHPIKLAETAGHVPAGTTNPIDYKTDKHNLNSRFPLPNQ